VLFSIYFIKRSEFALPRLLHDQSRVVVSWSEWFAILLHWWSLFECVRGHIPQGRERARNTKCSHYFRLLSSQLTSNKCRAILFYFILSQSSIVFPVVASPICYCMEEDASWNKIVWSSQIKLFQMAKAVKWKSAETECPLSLMLISCIAFYVWLSVWKNNIKGITWCLWCLLSLIQLHHVFQVIQFKGGYWRITICIHSGKNPSQSHVTDDALCQIQILFQ
jgi:hypothetical protein